MTAQLHEPLLKVSEIRDVSQRLAAIREAKLQRPPRHDPSLDEQDLRAWIESTFKLNYDL